jgi:hypothetical protein
MEEAVVLAYEAGIQFLQWQRKNKEMYRQLVRDTKKKYNLQKEEGEELVLEAGMRRWLTRVVSIRAQTSSDGRKLVGTAPSQTSLIEAPISLLWTAFRCTLRGYFTARRERAQRTIDLSSWGTPPLSLDSWVALQHDFTKFAETFPEKAKRLVAWSTGKTGAEIVALLPPVPRGKQRTKPLQAVRQQLLEDRKAFMVFCRR